MIISIFLFAILGFVGIYAWRSYKRLEKMILQKPENYPNVAQRRPNIKTIVLAGDSITQGNMSYNWADELAAEFGQYQFFNAGINADLSYTLLNRIDDIVAMAPHYVNILIGTNDINAVLQPKHHYYKLRKIDRSIIPNAAAYRANLHNMIGQLKTKTTAHLSIMSLPVISEDLGHSANLKADQYTEIIKEVAMQEGIVYLPLREKQKDFLLKNPKNSQIKYEQTPILIQKSALLHYVFKKGWDEITAKHGNQLTFDNLHLNSVGGGMIGNLVRAELANVPAI